MAEQKFYIEKERSLQNSEDYKFLRSKGIEYIEKLSSKIWTDYNVHDPGITQLEMLCYAITDLGYRSNYLIPDILSEGGSTDLSDHFFTARQILTNNPVTENDYRKALIDVKGVKNAWFEKAENIEPDFWLNCSKSRLEFLPVKKDKTEKVKLNGIYNVILEMEEDDDLGDLNLYCFERTIDDENGAFDIELSLPAWDKYFNEPAKPEKYSIVDVTTVPSSQDYTAFLKVKFDNGKSKKYKIKIHSKGLMTNANRDLIADELNRDDQDSLLHHYSLMIEKALSIVSDAYRVLHDTRNLCEDYYLFKAMDAEEIVVCADIEIASNSDLETALAEIYYEIKRFLSPPVNFYTIKELTEHGKKTDEIFNGPVLNHGFIDDDELEKSVIKNVIHVSDLIQIIMDIEGVTAVKEIMISNIYKCEIVNEGAKWCLKLKDGRAPKLSPDKSKIVFYKGMIPYRADEAESLKLLDELEQLNRPKRLSAEDYDIPIPGGIDRNIKNYYSIQNDFPLTYGIGTEGLPASADDKRKALAKQLQGYMLFFDQILANYFAQLAHVRQLFSSDPDVKKTYFSHNLMKNEEGNETDFPRLHHLLKDFVDPLDLDNKNIDKFSDYKNEWENYISNPDNSPPALEREELLESRKIYEDRRNRFLDHLMSRFAEQFTDYVLLMYTMDKQKAPSELIKDKINFLSDYDEVSYNRGKAFNYKDPAELWDTANVTGLERRVSGLLGIKNYRRRLLSDCIPDLFEIMEDSDNGEYWFELKNEEGGDLLTGKIKYGSPEEARATVSDILITGNDKDNFEILKISGKYQVELKDHEGDIIAELKDPPDNRPDAEKMLEAIINIMNESLYDCEGFHLIEHILLRPRTDKDRLMKVCVEEDCDSCPGFKDPYSFRATAVMPYWLPRFRNFDFRKYFETAIRLEAPAHVHIKICWVTEEQMSLFEKAYKDWLAEMAKMPIEQGKLTEKQNTLIEILESLRSVYPENRLYDCEEQDESDVVLLNHSILGSISEDENENL